MNKLIQKNEDLLFQSKEFSTAYKQISVFYLTTIRIASEDTIKSIEVTIVMLKRIFSAPRRVYIVELSEPPKALPKEASLRCKRIRPHIKTARKTCIQGNI